ncbi:MAG: hypothetical protein EPN70_16890 [Paraburkholderia sp.]|uniref:hypothetical protein n=1 Tax=Paraburkholderia sp. TaxID=1926495 RepID=UPI0011F4B701|nr:hypothetical protein [Paraburkholderia sp.]TAM02402.1 MAG: hypothetical protein EPN70_16890 [Paraburkholderia sp.]TAM31304.1 MAG: hypothetical protein EPN59_06375 [Paraburkholderia sp.]
MSTHPVRMGPAIAFALLIASGFSAQTQAQTIKPHPFQPMVKPPAAASGAASATNPDNMPVKKPTTSTHDKMSRDMPASAAKAK